MVGFICFARLVFPVQGFPGSVGSCLALFPFDFFLLCGLDSLGSNHHLWVLPSWILVFSFHDFLRVCLYSVVSFIQVSFGLCFVLCGRCVFALFWFGAFYTLCALRRFDRFTDPSGQSRWTVLWHHSTSDSPLSLFVDLPWRGFFGLFFRFFPVYRKISDSALGIRISFFLGSHL